MSDTRTRDEEEVGSATQSSKLQEQNLRSSTLPTIQKLDLAELSVELLNPPFPAAMQPCLRQQSIPPTSDVPEVAVPPTA